MPRRRRKGTKLPYAYSPKTTARVAMNQNLPLPVEVPEYTDELCDDVFGEHVDNEQYRFVRERMRDLARRLSALP